MRDGANVKRVGIGWTTALLIGSCACAGQTESGSPPEARSVVDTYDAGGRRIEVRIALDEIGIVVREGVGAEAIRELASRFGGRVAASFPGGLYVLRLDEVATRDALTGEAGRARRDAHVLQAGLVLYAGDGDPPQLATDELIVQLAQAADRRSIDQLNRDHRVAVAAEDLSSVGRYVLRLDPESKVDVLRMADTYRRSPLVVEAFPNLIQVFVDQ